MKRYCSNCGAQIPAAATVCPDCGIAADAAGPSPASGGGRHKAVAIVSTAAAAAVLTALVVWVLAERYAARPARQFLSCQGDLLAGVLAPVNAVHSAVGDHAHGGLTVSAGTDSAWLTRYLDGSSVCLHADVSDGRALVSGQLSLLGSTALSAFVTCADGKLGFWLPELDENYYVADLDRVLGDSAQAVLDALTSRSGALSDNAQPYLDILLALVNDRNVTREDGVPVTLFGPERDVVCTVYTFSPTGEDIGRALSALADRLEQDEDLCALLEDVLTAVQTGAPGLLPDTDAGEGQAHAVPFLRSSASWVSAQYGGSAVLTWTAAVEDGALRQSCLRAGDLGAIAYEEGVFDGVTGRWLSLTDGSGAVFPVLTALTEETDGTVDGSVSLSLPGGSVGLTYTAQPEKRSDLGIPYGEYALSLPGAPVELSLSVRDGGDGGADNIVTISGDEQLFGGMFSRLDLTVNAAQDEPAGWPEAEPVDISDYTPEQTQALTQSLARALQADVVRNMGALVFNVW